MARNHNNYRGFTMIELLVVITILSILATIAVLSYRRFGLQRYDSDAISNLTSLYEQTSKMVSDWGIGAGIDAKCRSIGPNNAGADGSSDNAASLNANNDIGLKLTAGSTHWRYKVCTGYLVGGEMEGVLVSAHRVIDGNERVLIMGSGIPSPVVACEGVNTKEVTETEGETTTTTIVKDCVYTPPVNVASTANSNTGLWSPWY